MITIYQHFSIDIFSASGTYNDSYTHYSARKFIEAHINLSDEQNGTNQMNSIIAVHWKRRKLFSNRQKTYQHSTKINYILFECMSTVMATKRTQSLLLLFDGENICGTRFHRFYQDDNTTAVQVVHWLPQRNHQDTTDFVYITRQIG